MSRRPSLSLLGLLLFSAACGGPGEIPDVMSRPAAMPAEVPESGRPGREVRPPEKLDFTLPGVSGGQVEGADYAGRDLVIWFWAPW